MAPTPGQPLFCCVGCRLAAAVGGRTDGVRKFLEARLLLSAFLSMGVMEFTLVLYGEGFYDVASDPSAALFRRLGQFGIAAFAFPVMLLLGVPLMRGAWADLRQGLVRMDGLIVIGTVAAFALSVYHTIIGVGQVYYETATMVLVLVMFGRRLEAHARSQGREAAKALRLALPERAHRVTSASETADVDADALVAGDRIRILPGENIPADVRIDAGSSAVVASHLTGEERPVDVTTGADVPAGAINGFGALDATVVRPWRDGGLGRILAHLDSPLPPTRLSRLVDRIATHLVWISLALAIVGGIRSGLLGGAGAGLRTALSVLVVACPCALGLATPLAFRATRASLARRGVLVRDPVAMEVAPSIGAVLLDKTGTLTSPAPKLRATAASDPAAFACLRTLVSHSGHALGAGLDRSGAAPAQLRVVPGCGVEGVVDGVFGRAGSPRWLQSLGATASAALGAELAEIQASGDSAIAFASDGTVRAVAAVAHEIRPGAREMVNAFRQRGIQVEIASGDRKSAVADVAASLGIGFLAELAPDQKLARLEAIRASGLRVMSVGDGVNDAPILRAADVGVAVATGTAVARSQAQVEIVGDDLRGLWRFHQSSVTLKRTVYGNIAWSLIYNGAALAFATMGRLHPAVAAAAMVISSVVVSVRSYRLMEPAPAPVNPAPASEHGRQSVPPQPSALATGATP